MLRMRGILDFGKTNSVRMFLWSCYSQNYSV